MQSRVYASIRSISRQQQWRLVSLLLRTLHAAASAHQQTFGSEMGQAV